MLESETIIMVSDKYVADIQWDMWKDATLYYISVFSPLQVDITWHSLR